MQYVFDITIFGLKMMVESGLEKMFFEISPCENHPLLIHSTSRYRLHFDGVNDL